MSKLNIESTNGDSGKVKFVGGQTVIDLEQDKLIVPPEASKEAKSVEPYNAVRDVLYSIIEHNANINSGVLDRKSLLELSVWNTYGIVDKVAYIKAIERVGLLTSYIRDGREKFYIGYNMLGNFKGAQP